MQDAGCRMQGAGCRVQGVGFRVQGSGFRVDLVTLGQHQSSGHVQWSVEHSQVTTSYAGRLGYL